MAPSSVETTMSGTTVRSEVAAAREDQRIQSATYSSIGSASSAWSTTHLPVERGEAVDKVNQECVRGRDVLVNQELVDAFTAGMSGGRLYSCRC